MNHKTYDVDMYRKAVAFAREAHKGQVRKGTTIPYIKHPLSTSQITQSMTDDALTHIVAVLHDVLEDTSVTFDDLDKEFGYEVADLVWRVSEKKFFHYDEEEATVKNHRGCFKLPWSAYKTAHVAELASDTDPVVQTVTLADKLSNMRDIARDHAREGEAFWRRFNCDDPKLIGRYYRSCEEVLRKNLGDIRQVRQLHDLIDEVFGSNNGPLTFTPPRIIAVDFDGTLCESRFPEIGPAKPEVLEKLKWYRSQGTQIILWTTRIGRYVDEAVDWCRRYDLEFDAVNDNVPSQIAWLGGNSRKVYATEYWDDKGVHIA